MILTPIAALDLPSVLSAFHAALQDDSSYHGRLALSAFQAATQLIPSPEQMSLSLDPYHHHQGVTLCQVFNMGVLDVAPQDYFSWDGQKVALRQEPSVLIHEVAHYQCASMARRHRIDFGLGAGPETGKRGEAEAARSIFGEECDFEEGCASILGILWEAQLGQPAIVAFLEQNWLELGACTHNVAYFQRIIKTLSEWGLIDENARPTLGALRAE